MFTLSGKANAQAPIIKCPIDTNAFFEVGIEILQRYDSTGRIEKQAYFDYGIRIPSEEFVDKESGKQCTPYFLIFEKDQIYIIDSVAYFLDSTGEWRINDELTSKVLLSPTKIVSLKIEIINETTKSVELSDFDLLQKLKFPISNLAISFTHHIPKKASFKTRNWNFIQFPMDLHSVYIHVPINMSKKQVLRNLNRFENLENIEIRNFK